MPSDLRSQEILSDKKIMMNFYQCFGWILFFLSISCQPLKVEYTGIESLSGSAPSLEEDSLGSNIGERILKTRSGQKEFKDRFLSDKLDMVFILDTGPGMESFYDKDLLKRDFLDQLSPYDWRWAYTDMSVDIDKLEGKTDGESKSSCNLSSLLFTGLVILEAPMLALFGVESVKGCFEGDNRSKKRTYANGSFLPLDHKDKAYIALKNFNQPIFYDSLKTPNPKNYKYKAPILRKSSSYPIKSMMLSLDRNLSREKKFFREDSLIVFVVFSLQDMKSKLSAESLQKSLKSAFGTDKRFKMIPVTLTEESNEICSLSLKNKSKSNSKLIQLAEDLDQEVLDICSPNLSDELFMEISKNLTPKDLELE